MTADNCLSGPKAACLPAATGITASIAPPSVTAGTSARRRARRQRQRPPRRINHPPGQRCGFPTTAADATTADNQLAQIGRRCARRTDLAADECRAGYACRRRSADNPRCKCQQWPACDCCGRRRAAIDGLVTLAGSVERAPSGSFELAAANPPPARKPIASQRPSQPRATPAAAAAAGSALNGSPIDADAVAGDGRRAGAGRTGERGDRQAQSYAKGYGRSP